MSEPVKVLHVLGTLNMGGAESRVMDLYRHIDRTKVQFDFLVHFQGAPKAYQPEDTGVRHQDYYDDEVLSLGGHIYVLPRFTGTNYLAYRRAVQKFFAAHHDYAVVEGHMTSTASIYLPIAKKAGIPVTIAHARSAGIDAGLHGKVTKWLRRDLVHQCDIALSCSREASIAVFGQSAVDAGLVRVVPNALDVESFRYDPRKRDKIRKEFHIPADAFVLGHVGRFDEMKNQQFLSKVLAALTPNAYCLFVGQGRLLEETRAVFTGLGLSSRTIFAGQCDRDRTIAMYQAFDAFCFPSVYEGLPGTVIEAQAAGLPCLISDTITNEVCVTDLVSQLSITSPDEWITAIRKLQAAGQEQREELAGEEQDQQRRAGSDAAIRALGEAGFDIVTSAVRMQNFYTEIAEVPGNN